MSRVKDASQRLEAVITPNHAFVSASAGTGKTHTLTLRTIYLLLTVEADRLYRRASSRGELQRAARDSLNSLVLTTFTKKASAEMQDRVFGYLNCIAGAENLEELEAERQEKDSMFLEVIRNVLQLVPGGDFELLRRGAQALAERSPELQISTLHSFASTLLSRYPVEAGIPLDARFESDDDPAGIDREGKLADIWLHRLATDGPRDMQETLEQVLKQIPLDNLREFMKQCLLHEWLGEALGRLAEDSPASRKAAEFCLDSLRMWCEGIRDKGGRLRKAKEIASSLENLILDEGEEKPGLWGEVTRILSESFTYMSATDSKPSAGMKALVAGLPGECREAFSEESTLYGIAVAEYLKRESRDSWESFLVLLDSFLEWGRENLVRETGVVTFDDMIKFAARLLGEYPLVQEREYSRLKSVLVDEFQDTDPVQLEMLRNLLARPAGSGHEVLGFFVGDVKQSIYRFRSADVSGVEDFQDEYRALVKCRLPVDVYRLETSFRSDPGIIDHANDIFNKLLNLERPLENLLSFHPEKHPLPEWRLVCFEDDKVKAHVKRTAMALAVEAAIREYMLEGRDSEEERSYRDVLILCRGYKELDPVIDVLKRAGIPVIASGRKIFQLNVEVVDTVSLLTALLDPLDSLSVGTVLKSPIVGLSDEILFRLFGETDPARIFTGDESIPDFVSGRARSQVESIVRLGRIWRYGGIVSGRETPEDIYSDETGDDWDNEEEGEEVSSVSLDYWMRMVLRLIPVEAYHRDNDLEGLAVSRITKVLDDFAEVLLDSTVPPLAWLLGEREKAVSRPDLSVNFSEDVSVSDESVNAARAMTIHKSKGLEGKFVIIAGWASLLKESLGIFDRNRKESVYDFPVPNAPRVRAFRFRWGGFSLESSNYRKAIVQDRRMETMESRRLAYVAGTRPRDRLLLLAPEDFDLEKKPGILENIEAYLEQAVKGRLVTRSVRESGELKEISGEGRAVPEIDRKAYLSTWTGRLEKVKEAEAKQEEKRGRLTVGPGAMKKIADASGVRSEEPAADKDIGIQIGSLVHNYLEMYLGDQVLVRENLESLARLMGPKPTGAAVVEKAREILERFYSGVTRDEKGSSLVERVGKARIMGREFPVMVEYKGAVQSRIIDLLLEEEDGITIVDYKTGGEPVELPERYRIQREAYTAAVERLAPGRKVAFEFWWL